MEDKFNIYIDRLGKAEETFAFECGPNFLEVNDNLINFDQNAKIEGRAYLADEHVIISVKVHSNALIPCKICNKEINLPIALKDVFITEELSNISNKVFNFQEPLRDAILLEIPLYEECEGSCPNRSELKKFLKE